MRVSLSKLSDILPFSILDRVEIGRPVRAPISARVQPRWRRKARSATPGLWAAAGAATVTVLLRLAGMD